MAFQPQTMRRDEVNNKGDMDRNPQEEKDLKTLKNKLSKEENVQGATELKAVRHLLDGQNHPGQLGHSRLPEHPRANRRPETFTTGLLSEPSLGDANLITRHPATPSFISPPIFNPEIDCALAFMRKYERTCAANGWTTSWNMAYLQTFLKGAACRWYELYKEKEENAYKTWSMVKADFINEFASGDAKRRLARRLKTRKQGKYESIRAYYYSLLDLFGEYDPTLNIQDFLTFFEEGMNEDLYTPYRMQRGHNMDWRDLRRIVDALEDISWKHRSTQPQKHNSWGYQASNHRGYRPGQWSGNHRERRTSEQDRTQELWTSPPTTQSGSGVSYPNTQTSHGRPKCFRCNRPGHYVASCQYNSRGGVPKGTRSAQQGLSVVLTSGGANHTPKILTVSCVVNNIQTTVVVDMGAERSLITRALVDNIVHSKNTKYLQTTRCLKTPSIGTAKFQVRIEQVRLTGEAIIIPKSQYPLILGFDFLNEHKAIIDLQNQTLRLQNKPTNHLVSFAASQPGKQNQDEYKGLAPREMYWRQTLEGIRQPWKKLYPEAQRDDQKKGGKNSQNGRNHKVSLDVDFILQPGHEQRALVMNNTEIINEELQLLDNREVTLLKLPSREGIPEGHSHDIPKEAPTEAMELFTTAEEDEVTMEDHVFKVKYLK